MGISLSFAALPAARNGTRFGWPGRFMWFTSCLKDVVRPTCTRRLREGNFKLLMLETRALKWFP